VRSREGFAFEKLSDLHGRVPADDETTALRLPSTVVCAGVCNLSNGFICERDLVLIGITPDPKYWRKEMCRKFLHLQMI
jgi:hypothetical protein